MKKHKLTRAEEKKGGKDSHMHEHEHEKKKMPHHHEKKMKHKKGK